jgi:mannose-6-phosphate isomerase-like protein (cupin superfamily)
MVDAEVIPFAALDPTPHSHEFVGAEHGGVSFSVILIHTGPGGGPAVHSHPYAEVFIVEAGEATFTLGDRQVVVPAGHVVVGPPDAAHGFRNTGEGELRITSIHGSPRFLTEWLEAHDGRWSSKLR